MDEGYTRLYLAIFKQAIIDSTKKVKQYIFGELWNRNIPKMEIHQFIDKHEKSIIEDIQQMVYAETQRWPDTNIGKILKNENRLRDKYIRKYFDELRDKERVS